MGQLATSGNARTRKRGDDLLVAPSGPLAGAQFTDDFNRSNRTLNGDNGWAVNNGGSGTVTIASNVTSFNSSANGAWCANTGSPTPNGNHWAAVQIVSGSGGNIMGVLGRYTDSSNFYLFRAARNASDTYELYKRVSNSYTLLNSLSQAMPAEPYYLRIYLVGTSIKGQLWNGTTWVDKCTATDSAFSTGTPGFYGQWVTSPSTSTSDNYGSGTAT